MWKQVKGRGFIAENKGLMREGKEMMGRKLEEGGGTGERRDTGGKVIGEEKEGRMEMEGRL